jgi:hypothetical protein
VIDTSWLATSPRNGNRSDGGAEIRIGLRCEVLVPGFNLGLWTFD